MTAEQIVTEIITGKFTKEELTAIYNAYSTAAKLNKEQTNALAMASMKVGAEGILKGISPKKWNGVKVIITKINQKRVEVREANKEFSYPFTVPAQCIELI